MGFDPAKIANFFVYSYHFIDDESFIPDAEEVLAKLGIGGKAVDDLLDAVSALFKENGWEGDGNIGLIWLPPFVGVGGEDTYGSRIWHVKQDNNGTSWLASEYRLPFKSESLRLVSGSA